VANYTYAFKGYDEKNMARAVGTSMQISTKQAIEVCSAIRNKPVTRAKRMLENAIDKKEAIKYTRFTAGAGHKRGIGPGKYPINTCKSILMLVSSAEKNAQNKGLSENLSIIHISAQQGPQQMKFGRQSRRMYKRTHVEVVLGEKGLKGGKGKKAKTKQSEQKEAEKKPTQSEQKKTEEKPKQVQTKAVEPKGTTAPVKVEEKKQIQEIQVQKEGQSEQKEQPAKHQKKEQAAKQPQQKELEQKEKKEQPKERAEEKQ